MSVLIAEDTRVAAKLLEMLLARMGHETVTVPSGKEALETLRARHDVELLITDLMMPGVDGFELIRTIKESGSWPDLPIIVTTAVSDLPKVKQLAVLGITRYLLKPVDRTDLERNVQLAFAERDKTLLSPSTVIAKLGLDPVMYETLATSFAEMADDSIRLIAESGAPDAIPAGLELRALQEAASMFDVARLQVLLERLIEAEASAAPQVGVRVDLEALAVALRSVARALRQAPAAAGAAPPVKTEPDTGVATAGDAAAETAVR